MKQILMIIAMAVLLVGCAEVSEPTIGFIGPLSGSDALIGTSVQRGVALAEAETDAYRFVYEDDQGKTAETVTAYHTLKAQGVDAIISVFSPQGSALAPLAEEDGILFCDVGASDPTIYEGRDYTVVHWLSAQKEAEKFAEQAEKDGFTHIVSLETQISGVDVVATAVEQALEEKGITLERNTFATDVTDFRTALTQSEDADAILLILFPGQGSNALKQLEELGFTQPLVSVEIYEYYNEETLAQLDEEDWYIFSSSGTDVFLTKFSAAYGDVTPSMSAHGYDCANLLMEALGRDDGLAWLHSLENYPGAVGTLTYDEGRIESPAMVKHYVNGRFQELTS